MVVTLGALLADVPHSRPVGITGLRERRGARRALGLSPTSYEGPTGIVGVLHAACQEAGLPSASLWASVPHYVAAAPNPKAALALVRKLESLVGVTVDAEELEFGGRRLRAPGLARRAERPRRAGLRRAPGEGRRGGGAESDPADLPSGDVIAREFQRFLRQRGPEAERPLTRPRRRAGTPGPRAACS